MRNILIAGLFATMSVPALAQSVGAPGQKAGGPAVPMPAWVLPSFTPTENTIRDFLHAGYEVKSFSMGAFVLQKGAVAAVRAPGGGKTGTGEMRCQVSEAITVSKAAPQE